MTDDAPPAGGTVVDDPPWRAWRPGELAGRLDGVRAPWCVTAGWAVDLHLGTRTRAHGDLEVAVPAAAFGEIRRALPELTFRAAGSGRLWPVDDDAAFAATFQTWAWDPAASAYRVDVFRDPHDGDTWVCRRDPHLRIPYTDLVRHTSDGIPYQRPDVVLLFKAKRTRTKDEADFAHLLPALDATERAWLSAALARVHPGHPWLASL